MKSETISGLHLFYEPEELDAALLIGAACEKSVQLIQQYWDLPIPEDCRVYVMTSWQRFLLHSAPWYWKIVLVSTFPLIAARARSIWPFAGGWSLQMGTRRVVGVKPPHLIQISNRSLGEQLFIQNRDRYEIVQTVTCHELVHAFTFQLKLPTWLNEGIATLAMELYLDKPIVQRETLERLVHPSADPDRRGIESVRVNQPQALLYQYVRGYWLARYINETRTELLRELLAKRQSRTELERKMATAYGKDPESFWSDIDEELCARFG